MSGSSAQARVRQWDDVLADAFAAAVPQARSIARGIADYLAADFVFLGDEGLATALAFRWHQRATAGRFPSAERRVVADVDEINTVLAAAVRDSNDVRANVEATVRPGTPLADLADDLAGLGFTFAGSSIEPISDQPSSGRFELRGRLAQLASISEPLDPGEHGALGMVVGQRVKTFANEVYAAVFPASSQLPTFQEPAAANKPTPPN